MITILQVTKQIVMWAEHGSTEVYTYPRMMFPDNLTLDSHIEYTGGKFIDILETKTEKELLNHATKLLEKIQTVKDCNAKQKTFNSKGREYTWQDTHCNSRRRIKTVS